MDRDGVKVHKLANKEGGNIKPSCPSKLMVNKGFTYGFRGNFSCGTWQVVQNGQDSSILPAQVAKHSVEFDSSCPLTELSSHKIKMGCGKFNAGGLP